MKRANQTTVAQPTFERNGFYERIIALRKTQPKAFESLSPATKMALGAYEQQKRQHALDEAMRNESRGRNEAA
jgi:hypothetical protein